MFRAQANPMDESIVKATDENLTSENWELIFDVVDRVSASPSGPQQAVASLIKRLAHRNANVQLYTLELANALSQNCGPGLHRELASKAFTDSLLRLASDRNSHAQVKQKVLERMSTWTEEFGRNPELGIMEQAYQKLRVQQPSLMPPSKPAKQEVSTEDRRKEDEELQMALSLSLREKAASPQANGTSRDDSQPQPSQAQAGAPQSQQGTTAATVSRVKALFDFTPSEPGELAFRKNDIIAVLESVYKDWWKGSLRGNTGIFPLNYVEKLQDPTKEELERDAHMEAEVFGEIKNVEKLLALLSVRGEGGGQRRGEREEEEISELYQRTLSIRPKLIELIGKYSQKKDDFTQLNEKFIKARRDYEALLESSMAQPQYQQHFPIRPRQSSHQMYPPQQQAPPYSGAQQQPPPQNYPPQGGPPSAQGYPPQQPFAQQSQQHLPPQQDVQRFYSPTPSEPPAQQQQQQQQQPGLSSPYPPQNGPPVVQSSNINTGPAPFHFIPGGLQSSGPPPPQQQQEIIRRKPSPQAPLSAVSPGDNAYTASSGQQQQQPPPPQPAFHGQIRPNSIHTLNSGNPQELASGGYESPVDNRHSYPSSSSAQQMAGGGVPVPSQMLPQQQHMQNLQQGYDGYPLPQQQQQQQAPPPPQQQPPPLQQIQQPPPMQQPQQQPPPPPMPSRNDRDALPSRQRTHSLESPSSVYSQQQQQQDVPPWGQAQAQQQMPPSQLVNNVAAPYPGYQAYQPQPEPQRLSGGGAPGDPGDFYR